jgi:hypothetical protein
VTAAAAVEPTPQEPAEETPPSPQEPGEQGRPAETGAPAPAEPDSGQEPQSADVGQEPQPEEAEQALASQAVAPGSDAEAHLQLGIYTDEAAAQVAADESSARFRSTLGTNTVRVVPLEREQGTLFRLMSGPYASVGEARNSCGEIVQAGGDCLVVLRGRATSPVAPPTEASAADQVSGDQASGDQASGDQASAGVRGPEQAAPAGDQNQPGPGDEQARSFVATPPVGLNYRAGPSVDAARLGALPEGTVVELVSTQDGWARVRLPDGQSAYVDRRFIRPLE